MPTNAVGRIFPQTESIGRETFADETTEKLVFHTTYVPKCEKTTRFPLFICRRRVLRVPPDPAGVYREYNRNNYNRMSGTEKIIERGARESHTSSADD